MPQIMKGPLSVEDAAQKYATGIYKLLRFKGEWRKDSFRVLRGEYDRFAREAIAGWWDPRTMWEYGWLVEATHQYLRYKHSGPFATWFYRKARADLAGIAAQLNKVVFDEHERASMTRAYDHMLLIIEGWETRVWEKQKEARE